MASTIQLKTGTGSAVPSSLTQGEVAINIDNGLIYYGSGSGTDVKQLESFTHITASGNISASGAVIGKTLTLGGTAVTSTAAELNKMDGVTATTAEINYIDGVSSAIQTQLNSKFGPNGGTFVGNISMSESSKLEIVGSATLDVRLGTFNTTSAQNLTIIQNASSDIDIGAHNFRAATLQADELSAGRVVVTSTDGILTNDSDLTFATDTLTATKIGAFEAAGAINFNNQNMTNVDIDSGTIDNTDVTVGSGKTLNVSAGTLTTSAAQKQAIVAGADGAAIDNCVIGATTAVAATFTDLTSTTSVTKGIPFVIGKESGYLASFTDDNYYYGNNAYGWSHHGFTNNLPNSPLGTWGVQTDGGTAIGTARQHNAQIVPIKCKNITLIGEADMSTNGNTFAFFIYKTTRMGGSSTIPTITQIGTTSVTLAVASRYYNIDITTTEGVAAGDKILIVVRPGGTSGQVRWTYTLFGYTNG